MISRGKLRVAVFPGAANVPLYAGVDTGAFAAAGLRMELIEVGSSAEQLELWDSGHCDVMHTSPDHLLREQRPRDPVVVRRDGFGELRVYRRPEQRDVRSIVWAVDALATGFAFLLRAIVEEEAGIGPGEQQLEAVGGTKQRFEALMNPAAGIGGTTLHPPFDGLAHGAGMVLVGGHLQRRPHMIVQATVVSRAALTAAATKAYLAVMDAESDRLLRGGHDAIERALAAHGMPPAAARAGGDGLMGPGGLGEDRAPGVAGLRDVAALRARFQPGWSPARGMSTYLAEVPA